MTISQPSTASASIAAGTAAYIGVPAFVSRIFRHSGIYVRTDAGIITTPGGTIRLSCDAEAGWVRVHVHDTGVGIPVDRLESIFDPFVQVDRALNRPHEGVGLGLSISRDLAQGMGGTLTVRSSVENGSTFTLRLRGGELD